MTSARTQRSEPGIGYNTDLTVPTCRKQENRRPGLRHQERSAKTVRLVQLAVDDRERCKESASVIGGTGRRRVTSALPGNPREPRVYWRSSRTPGQVNTSTAFYI